MKPLVWMAMIGLAAPLALQAQTTPNPVVSSAREIVTRQAKFITAAAEAMPADKYSYHPTPDQRTFGAIVAHITQADNYVCAKLSDTAAPKGPKLSATDPKDTLVAALKASFAFCDQALGPLTDAQLGDTITFLRGAKVPRAAALFEQTDDMEDHYSQMASYLRLNGMTPPSAQPMH